MLVTALWALSPLQTNGVTYLVQRMTSLAALFYLTSLTLYIHGRRSATATGKILFFGTSAIAAVLAFLSKQNTATLPLMILLVESFFITPGFFSNRFRLLKRRHWLAISAALLLLSPIAVALFERHILPGYQTREFTLPQRLLTEPRVIVFYLSLLLLPLPSRLNLEHDFTVSQTLISPPTTILSLLFLLTLLFCAVRCRHSRPLISFGIFWFLLNLIIESSFIPLEIIFEHRLYLPSVGFFLVIIACIDHLLTHINPIITRHRSPQLLLLVVAVLTVFSANLTHSRNHDWRDSLSFYEDCIKKSPNKQRPRLNYGLHLIHQERYKEGVRELQKSLTLMGPNKGGYELAANGIMMDLARRGQPDKAIAAGQRFLKILRRHRLNNSNENLNTFVCNLADIYRRQKLYQPALATYRFGLQIDNTSQPLTEGLKALISEEDKENQDNPVLKKRSGREEIYTRTAMEMINVKKYAQATIYLDRARDINPQSPVVLSLAERLTREQGINSHQSLAVDITNHPPFQKDRRYRYVMITAAAIYKYYHPLQPLATWLWRQAGDIYPQDPFIDLAQTRARLLNSLSIAEANTIIRNALQRQPEFVPIHELAAQYYLDHNQNRKAATMIYRLIELYPGHPKWNFF
ncbi:MAG: hypothetical protein OEL66_10685, partial [Desulfobulbaceae bacterium]|nr:hypothetical protein [Desulfobulbaceae bacterium]